MRIDRNILKLEEGHFKSAIFPAILFTMKRRFQYPVLELVAVIIGFLLLFVQPFSGIVQLIIGGIVISTIYRK